MQPLLSGAGLEALDAWRAARGGKLLLAFDFDGTLVELAPRPEQVRLPAATRRLLGRLSRKRDLAVLSGRARANLTRQLKGVRVRWVVGNHGAEGPWPSRVSATSLARWRATLEPALPEGAWLEDKGHSLTVHYRQARSPARVGARVWRLAGTLRGARRVAGTRVVNVVPKGSPDKGQALLKLLRLGGYRGALYLGDDVTDEDVLGLNDPRVFGVRVGRSARSAARWYVGAGQVERLLQVLLGW